MQVNRLETDAATPSSFISSSRWSLERVPYPLWAFASSCTVKECIPTGFWGPCKHCSSLSVSLSHLKRPHVLLRMADSSPSPKTQAWTSAECFSQLYFPAQRCPECGRPENCHSYTHGSPYPSGHLNISCPHPFPPKESQLPS